MLGYCPLCPRTDISSPLQEQKSPKEQAPLQEQTPPPLEQTIQKQAPPGAGTPPGADTRPRSSTPPKQAPPQSSAYWEIRPTSERYASYWNAFLFDHRILKDFSSFSGDRVFTATTTLTSAILCFTVFIVCNRLKLFITFSYRSSSRDPEKS